jgi:hypothetical protein
LLTGASVLPAQVIDQDMHADQQHHHAPAEIKAAEKNGPTGVCEATSTVLALHDQKRNLIPSQA